MTLGKLRYTSRDYSSMLEDLLRIIPEKTNRWTYFGEDELGMVLLELLCYIGDQLNVYLDAKANESYLPTVIEEKNLRRLLKLISYKMHPIVSATTKLKFEKKTHINQKIHIEAGFRVQAVSPDGETIEYITIQKGFIPEGEKTIELDAIQGKSRIQEYIATGQPDQKYVLENSNIAWGSIFVQVGDEQYIEVETLFESQNSGKHYEVIPEIDSTMILFGDGFNGFVPSNGEPIHIRYIESVGAKGNRGSGTITKCIDMAKTENEEAVDLKVSNIIPATGGKERETGQHAKKYAPEVFRSQWRMITKRDIWGLVESFPGVIKAAVVDKNTIGSPIDIYDHCWIYVLAEGGNLPSEDLLSTIQAFCEARKPGDLDILVKPFSLKFLNINCRFRIYRGFHAEQTIELAKRRVEDFFHYKNINPEEKRYIDHYALAEKIRDRCQSGIANIDQITPMGDIEFEIGEFPILEKIQFSISGES